MNKYRYRELTLSELYLSKEDIYMSMGYSIKAEPEQNISDCISEVLKETEDITMSKYMFKILKAKHISNKIKISQNTFSLGNIISSYLEGLTHACVFVATAGKEFEEYLQILKHDGNIVKEFVADSIGSVIAEACVSKIIQELKFDNDLKHTLPYSPGYCGWNILEQKKLFSLFPDRPCGISLSNSCLMTPIKSVSGFIGMGKTIKLQPYSCDICSNKYCYKRKKSKYEY